MSPATPDPLLTPAEVKSKIASCIGGTGEYTYRKWTSSPPVLTRLYLPNTKQPRYRLSDVTAALNDLQPTSHPAAS
jgi:hypothetical protein